MRQAWGRFSVRGSAAFEDLMSGLMTEIAVNAERVLSPDVCRAMVLLGGYGRGEGGVMVADGSERPHNNLDFLVITPHISPEAQRQLKTQIHSLIQPMAQTYGIEFDIGTITEARLRRSPSLVMWYDMRFGHKTVVGDAALVPSLTQFSAERIPAWDVQNLLVNRGTLLVINDQLLATREPRPEDRRRIVKHAMKAIIGYGDALLYFAGRYDWSYVEKMMRMRVCPEAPEQFRALYDEAVAFRFQPNYSVYADRDLTEWMNALRRTLASIHLECERMRLQCQSLTWKSYPETALQHAILDDARAARAWAKKGINLLRTPERLPRGFSARAKLGCRMLGVRGTLTTVFPVAAYHLDDTGFRDFAAQVLGVQATSLDDLRRAYLFRWGSAIEPPFLDLARKWDLALE